MFKYMSFFRRLVRLLYQFFYVMLILNSVYGLFNQPIISFKWWLYVFGLLAVSYTLRDVMSRGIVLFFGHAAVGVLTFFVIRDVYLKYVLMVVLLVFFIGIHNVKIRISAYAGDPAVALLPDTVAAGVVGVIHIVGEPDGAGGLV